jgi:hypothetical protein
MVARAAPIMAKHQQGQPSVLKAFDADFRLNFLRRVSSRPVRLMPRLIISERSGVNGNNERSGGNTSKNSQKIISDVKHVDLAAQSRVANSAKPERYLVNEAEYIRMFGY